MGTRGFITFVVNGEEKTAYNHFDSYPEGIGVGVLRFAQLLASDADLMAAARKAAADLIVVDEDSVPSPEQIARLKRFADPRVSTGDLGEWYVLLRHTQGDPAAMLDAGAIIDASEFPLDSLFAEYGYVIDFDRRLFEVYGGYQRGDGPVLGRFADRESTSRHADYGVSRLAAVWPLEELPTEADFFSDLEMDEETETGVTFRALDGLSSRYSLLLGERPAVASKPAPRAITAS